MTFVRLAEALDELKDLPRWVCWHKLEKDGRITKPPLCPEPTQSGAYRWAKPSDPRTWATFQEAALAAKGKPSVRVLVGRGKEPLKTRIEGVGLFVGGGLVGIDIDHCRDPRSGELSPQAVAIVDMLDSYTEISPSGDGLHILVNAECEIQADKSVIHLPECNGRPQHIDFFTGASSHYVTITGNPLDGPDRARPIYHGADRLESFIQIYATKPKTAEPDERAEPAALPSVESSGSPKYHPGMTDTEMLEWMFSWKNGASIHALYDGDMTRYEGDPSGADMALAGYLAFATRFLPSESERLDTMDRLFRASGLFAVGKGAEQWDKRHSGDGRTYGQMTLERAAAGCPLEVWKDTRSSSQQKEKTNKNTNKNTEGGEERGRVFHIVSAGAYGSAEPGCEVVGINYPQATLTLSDSDESPRICGFMEDVSQMGPFRDRCTGFEYLDKDGKDDTPRPFYPGLYVIGGESGMGKTTFALQLANQLAEQNEHVLYFSLEQGRFDLYSKSLACALYIPAVDVLDTWGERSSVELYRVGARTSQQLRNGDISMRADSVRRTYNEAHMRMHFVDCGFGARAMDITETTLAYLSALAQRDEKDAPVTVIVDYLQALSSPDPRMSERAAIDDAVHMLKTLQRDGCRTAGLPGNLTVIVLSSFGRQNYGVTAGLASFKESGGIEYTADVVWALQLRIVTEGDHLAGDGKNKTQHRRKATDAVMAQDTRPLSLVCLKNRFGRAGFRVPIEYVPAYDHMCTLSPGQSAFDSYDEPAEIEVLPTYSKRTMLDS